MMPPCGIQRAPLHLVLLQVFIALSVLHHHHFGPVDSLSISSSKGNAKNSLTSAPPITTTTTASVAAPAGSAPAIASARSAQQQQIQYTTLPPLITTISQNNYLDSLVAQQQQQQSKQQQQIFENLNRISAGDTNNGELQASSSTNSDDTVPLATINNHSRNNQPVARPPQYVDVSALVGRDRNSTGLSSGQSLMGQTAMGQGNGTSGLSPKSRSGLPECATQQVCNAIFVRMNYTQKLCECSSNYNWKCSNNLDPQDGHTIELTRKFDKRIYTQIKTCEPLREVRACKSPTDWTLLALQSERSGKAHYVVVCKCPTWAQLEGPYTHNHPPYANIPGIRVYGMLCAHQTARSSAQTYATYNPALSIYPEFPWSEALSVLNTTNLLSTLDSH